MIGEMGGCEWKVCAREGEGEGEWRGSGEGVGEGEEITWGGLSVSPVFGVCVGGVVPVGGLGVWVGEGGVGMGKGAGVFLPSLLDLQGWGRENRNREGGDWD
jgi:hypothetical protein